MIVFPGETAVISTGAPIPNRKHTLLESMLEVVEGSLKDFESQREKTRKEAVEYAANLKDITAQLSSIEPLLAALKASKVHHADAIDKLQISINDKLAEKDQISSDLALLEEPDEEGTEGSRDEV